MFDWELFLTNNSIPFVTRGVNIGRNDIGIYCPFCGEGDQNFHMAIDVNGKGWSCRRNKEQHSGKSPIRLIQALLGCRWEEAKTIVGSANPPYMAEDGSFASVVGGYMGEELRQPTAIKSIEYPPTLHEFTKGSLRARPFINYLINRGYQDELTALDVAKAYSLRYCCIGAFVGRLIIPVIMEEGLVSWTGRSIYTKSKLRYRALSADKEVAERDKMPVAPVTLDQTLFNYKELLEEGGECLVTVEGPLDAIKLDWLGKSHGIRATCLWTKSLSDYQIVLLGRLANKFRYKKILLDKDAELDQFSHFVKLESFGFKSCYSLGFVKDPGELSSLNKELLGDLLKG